MVYYSFLLGSYSFYDDDDDDITVFELLPVVARV